jgi:protein TonB
VIPLKSHHKNTPQNNIAVINEESEGLIPWELVDEKPSFQGGDVNTFKRWVGARLIYPETAKENGVEGSVTVQVRINTDGSLTAKVIRGCDLSLDKEALRVISQSPKWEPGKQNGQTVPVVFTYSVPFRLF